MGWLCQNSFPQAAGRVTCHLGVWSCQSPLENTTALIFCVCIDILLNTCRDTAPPPPQADQALSSTKRRGCKLVFRRIWSRNFSPLLEADAASPSRKLDGCWTRYKKTRWNKNHSVALVHLSHLFNYFSASLPAWLTSSEPLTIAVTSKLILKYVTSLDWRLFGTLHSITYTLGCFTNPVLLSGTLHLQFSFYILGSNFSRECNKTHRPLPLMPHKTNLLPLFESLWKWMAKSLCVTRTSYTFGKDQKSGLSFLTLGLPSISSYRKACALEGNSLMNAVTDRSWRRDQGGASESSEFADVTCGMGSCSRTPKYASSGDRRFLSLVWCNPFHFASLQWGIQASRSVSLHTGLKVMPCVPSNANIS